MAEKNKTHYDKHVTASELYKGDRVLVRLPVDLAFGLPLRDKADVTHSQYVKNLKSSLEESFRIAVENSKRMAEKNKTCYDKHVTASDLDRGDTVLVRGEERGKNKLADKSESESERALLPSVFAHTRNLSWC